MSLKIAVIGAGSLSFTVWLVKDLTHFDDLFGSEIVLMDTDDSRLSRISNVAQRMNEVTGNPFNIGSTTNRREALERANFVVVSIETLRENSWKKDFAISEKYGIYQPHEENGGPGGFAHAMRQIPAIMDICHDMEQICPDAWIINLSNPMTQICLAIHRHTDLNFVGLCHGIQEIREPLAQVLGVEKERLDLKAAGINHFTWILNMTLQPEGQDMYPIFKEKLPTYDPSFMPLARDLFNTYGLFPSPSDSHIAEYLHLCPKETWEKYNIENFDIDAYTSRLNNKMREIIEVSKDDKKLQEYLAERSPVIAVDIISAISHDTNTFCPAVNIPNEGCVANLPDDSVVEIPAIASAQGMRGISMGKLPSSVASLCQRALTIDELTVDAIVKHDYNLALQALSLDPHVNSIDSARKILDEFLSVYKGFVPELR